MRIFTLALIFLTSCALSKPVPPKGFGFSPVSSGTSFKQDFLRRVNKLRASGCNCGSRYYAPAPALTWNDELAKAAKGHASDMYRKGYFSHTSRNGNSLQTRLEAAGYSLAGYQSYSYGENIAAGQRSIEEVMNSWIKSPGHCKNLMNPKFKEIGVAETNFFWVQDFGMRQEFSSSRRAK